MYRRAVSHAWETRFSYYDDTIERHVVTSSRFRARAHKRGEVAESEFAQSRFIDETVE